jgi:hypothetical protein
MGSSGGSVGGCEAFCIGAGTLPLEGRRLAGRSSSRELVERTGILRGGGLALEGPREPVGTPSRRSSSGSATRLLHDSRVAASERPCP